MLQFRDNILKSMGSKKSKQSQKDAMNRFKELSEKDEKYKKMLDIPIPREYLWIWKHFRNIWHECEYDFNGNIIFTYRTVNDYVECMKVPLTVKDKKCLFRMKDWALETISEVRKDKE